jgi:hypothetical protein
VATAASRVRFARNPRQAIQAVRMAIAAVHKSIALLRADDPVTLKTAPREGASSRRRCKSPTRSSKERSAFRRRPAGHPTRVGILEASGLDFA